MSTLTKVLDVRDVQTQLADLITLVRSGAEVVFAEGSTIVARLASPDLSSVPRLPGLHPGAIWMSDDFDAPLPDGFWTSET